MKEENFALNQISLILNKVYLTKKKNGIIDHSQGYVCVNTAANVILYIFFVADNLLHENTKCLANFLCFSSSDR